jgi:hypothetical protein
VNSPAPRCARRNLWRWFADWKCVPKPIGIDVDKSALKRRRSFLKLFQFSLNEMRSRSIGSGKSHEYRTASRNPR